MKTTSIKTRFGRWDVPRGFGAAYMRVAREHVRLLASGKPGEVIHGILHALCLVGYDATESTVAEWDARRRVEAEVFAGTVHLRAADNPIPKHPPLAWLPEPWGGGDTGDVFGPKPTVLR